MVTTTRDLSLLPDDDFLSLVERAPPEHVWPLWRARLRHNLPEFCRWCWPERFNLPFNELHESLFELGDIPPWNERVKPDLLDAVAAPRGYAKSTIVSFAMLAHAIVYDLEAYIVMISATQRLSRSLSRDLRSQFRAPRGGRADMRPMARLFGPFDTLGGVDEWEVSVRGRPPVGILAASFGTEVRGAKHPERGIRPTLVLIDDGEKKDRVRNPDQRKIWQDTLSKDILKLSDRKRATAVRFVGTILHPDSILARREVDPGWRFQKWRAIIKWPERADLWEQCGAIWKDLTLEEHRRPAALAFYEQNRQEMDAGVELLDPGSRGIFELYEVMWGEGLSAFLQEMQNDPVDPAAQIFVSDAFVRFSVEEGPDGLVLNVRGPKPRTVRVKDLRLTLRWDPSMGGADGDPAAIAVLGRDRFGYKYVLDVWMANQVPSLQHGAMWTLAERWRVKRGTYEDDGFQELVASTYPRERKTRRKEERYWRFQLVGRGHGGKNKNERIAAMQPDTVNGWLLFNDSIPRDVLEQFDQHPNAAHDDGPDAVEGAWKDLGGSPVGMVA